MLFQFTGMNNSNKDATRGSPDLSAERGKETTILFLPGPAPSFLLFIVFGTTTPFRRYMYATFVPTKWQKISDVVEENEESAMPSKCTKGSTGRIHSIAISSPSRPHHTADIHMTDLEKGTNRLPNGSDDIQDSLAEPEPAYYRVHISRMRRPDGSE
ncbi:hypothetical protein JX265_008174 [Neoarthrinium moseri]|uniref:Uncharacterized protein n=2 Tax=Neoarthrinium moseri TaxID=1658444 RepID=A0A9Q0AKA3_9PEZI|nr:hypothetical protein JX265_008174 [Neoarthrinium moseri]